MQPRKILAMKLRSLGDTVLMAAPLTELAKAFPTAEIQVAVLAPWAPLLENHPAVSRIWAFERHKDPAARAKAVARLALRLRKERFDAVVNFHASPSSAIIAFATGAKVRSVHFHGHRDKNRHSTVKIPGKGVLKPIIERDMDAVRALGVEVPAGRIPALRPDTRDWTAAAEWLGELGLPEPILGLGLGASRPTKCWPVANFAEVALQWCARTGGSVLVMAGPQDGAVAAAFSETVGARLAGSPELGSLGKRIRVEKRGAVKELMAVISRLAVFCGNDSGPRHVAVAVGTPTVTVFGPEDPYEWHPYPSDLHPRLFIEELPCRRDAEPGFRPWCGIETCVAESHRCMTGIHVKEVFEACRQALEVQKHHP